MKKKSKLTRLLGPVMLLSLMVGAIVSSPRAFAADSNSPEGNGNQQVETTEVTSSDSVKVYVKPEKHTEVPPKYKDGEQGALKILAENMRYPVEAASQHIQGFVVVQGNVNIDGEVEEFKIERSSGNEDLDNEALRVCQENLSTGWIPGTQDGEKVKTFVRIPIKFSMN